MDIEFLLTEITEWQLTKKEFEVFHKKHIFDVDQQVCYGFEELINKIDKKIKRLKEELHGQNKT